MGKSADGGQGCLSKVHIEQQNLIYEISKCLILPGSPAALVNDALGKLGRYNGASRAVIVGIDNGRGESYLAYNWYADNAPPLRTNEVKLRGLIEGTFPAILHEAGVPAFSCGDVSACPEERLRVLSSMGVAAFIWAPIYVKGRLWGILSVEECGSPRAWDENKISLTAAAANVITGAVMRGIYYKQREEALERAAAANAVKNEFLAKVSHELRTPMNAIIGMTSIGEYAPDMAHKDYALAKIKEASSHLLGVINDVLDMSHIEANSLELLSARFHFEKMLQRIADDVNFSIEDKNQTFHVHVDPRLPHLFIGDEKRLAQVIMNLLSNAMKFTPEGGDIRLNAMLAGEVDETCKLRIEVRDTGIGISPDQQAKLFKSFQQVDGGVDRKYGGIGLGLSISKRIVELMDGNIWIESELGQGSAFIFTVSLRRALGVQNAKVSPAVRWDNLRILVVDDMEDIRAFFLDVLRRLDLTCDVAEDGEEACRLIEERGAYDIYFVDWYMPGMDGVELTRRIKAQTDNQSVVIVMSSSDWTSIQDEASDAGIDRYVLKPLYSATIVDSIIDCLNIDGGGPLRPSLEGEFAGCRVLLAEDAETNREILLAMLQSTGVEIDCAENGARALRMFDTNAEKYDMIFMDVQMPEMDGFEAARRIRRLPYERARTIPIIAMTPSVFKEDLDNCLAAGMNDHISKPLNIDEISEKLRLYQGNVL